MSRWKAASIHLCISISIGLLTLCLLFGVWYPHPFFHAGGADRLVLLLVGVDFVLGPLLTLIVFRSGKKYLKLDLAVIGMVQTMALIYGLSVILRSRPVFLVASVDRFNVVAANELTDKDLAEGSKPEFRTRSWTGPRLVATARPHDPHERSSLIFSGIAGKDIQDFPKYYVDYDEQAANLLKRAKPLALLQGKSAAAVNEIDSWLSSHSRRSSDVVWLPVVARDSDITMLMDAHSGQPLGAIAVDPW